MFWSSLLLPNATIVVDDFKSKVDETGVYFLSHFHSDHYGGLSKGWAMPVYCSESTSRLVILQLHVDAKHLRPLPMDEPTMVGDVEVTLIDAQHCPGAVLFVFKLPTGQVYLHTGDFRASQSHLQHPAIRSVIFDAVLLDTTYCDAKYRFPPQDVILRQVADIAVKARKLNPQTLFVVGTYTIGKVC